VKKQFLSLLLLLFVLLNSSSALAKTLRVVLFGGPVPAIDSLAESFDPDSYSVITQIFDSLIHCDLDGNLQAALATSWKMIDEATYEFCLREGVTFHNGEKFDAEAVKFTYETIIDPTFRAGNSWIFGTVKGVEIVEPYKIKIHLKQPDGMFLYRLTMFGSICPPETIKTIGWEVFHEHPIGTGPYKLISWKKGKQITFEKNPDYWQEGLPKTDKLIFKVIPENHWAEALINNEVDMVPNLSGKDTLKVKKAKNVSVVKRLVLQGYWVLLKNKGPLADVRVRRALNYAIDKQKLIKMGDFGNGEPLGGIGKKGELGYNPQVKPYFYDLDKARQLLKEAGYSKGFTLKCLAADLTEGVAKYIKGALKKIDVTVELEIVSRPQWTQEVIVGKIKGTPYSGDMAINLVDNPIIDVAFHMGLFLESVSPWSFLDAPDFDGRYQAALKIADLAEHEKALQKLDQYIHDQAFMIFTYQKIKTLGYRKNIKIPGVPINGHINYNLLPLTEVEE